MMDRYKLIAEIVKGKRVLDVGCVDHSLKSRDITMWLHHVICHNANYVLGMDYEKEAIDDLRKEGYNVICADATDFDLNEKFDVIVAGEFIEHLVNPGLFLQCARKHLEDDGILVTTTPNAQGLIYFLQNLFIGHEIDNPDHVCFHSPRTLSALLYRSGFSVEQVSFIVGFTPQGHTNKLFFLVAWIKNVIKLPLYFLRPSMCHRFLVLSRRMML